MLKAIRKYSKIYKNALSINDISNIDVRIESYEQRLQQMYVSQAFEEHNVYPSMDVFKIYAVIAMCLELKQYNYSDKEIIDIVNSGFAKLRKALMFMEKIIDSLPFAYEIAEKWNISDHENRMRDGSITYDYFNVSEGKIEYRISKCMYAEMFEYYGICSLCKIFCITDETAYSNLTKHVKFIRHSDLSDGVCCYDEVLNKKIFETTHGVTMNKTENKREREKHTVSLMIRIYCKKQHGTKKGLCLECQALNDYAIMRSDKCPFMETKTFCSNCKVHCYKAEMREKIRAVMRFSGPRMIFSHPIMAIRHVIESKREKKRLEKEQNEN